MKKRRFVLGDPHGAHKAIMQVFEQAGFNYKKDELICLGDVADGWPQVPECFEELLKINNLVYIMGNHDAWFLDFCKNGSTPRIWTSQGGRATIDAYERVENIELLRKHQTLLEKAPYYHITEDNKCFVHGGFNWTYSIEKQSGYNLTWDRELFYVACGWKEAENLVQQYDEVFIGHTTTSRHDRQLRPVHASNVWNLDQGAGWEGKLTLMNIDTKEYFQSDLVYTLYPNEKRRR